MSFTDDVRKFQIRATENIDVAARQVALSLFSKVIKATPVGNPTLWKSNELALLQRETYQVYRESIGKKRVSDRALQTKHGFKIKAPAGYVGGRARGNWQATIGPATTAVETDTKDKTGETTVASALSTLGDWKPATDLDSIIWIGNALPYIIRLEYDSWSTQAPAGMVRVAISEIRTGKL